MSTGSPQPGHTVGGEAPMGNSGHESCWDRGEVQSNHCCLAINASPLLLPAGRRGAGGAEPPASYAGTRSRGCAVGQPGASPSREGQRGRSAGPWGSTAVCQLLPPSRCGSGAERGRWRLPGFWLRSATELGRRCHGSLRFNRAAAAPR